MTHQMMKQRVLIVNKDAHGSHLYANILDRAGYRVHQATTLSAACSLMTKYTFAMFLWDMEMEEGAGKDFLREQGKCLGQQNTRLIILSANQDTGLDAGLQAEICLDQPADIASLLSLADYLKHHTRCPNLPLNVPPPQIEMLPAAKIKV